ncbi:hypothetical protein [Flavisphingomonas formosensis]|uniref:hypothetical protein n=1 Tax=Flavisphingomonas formosensis TaxID=861534 RepID=UPI0012FA62C7|nr:hypothetical protein [Sphingomonas formosensis]
MRTSRLAIAAGFVAVLAIGGAGFLLGRVTRPDMPPPVTVPAVLPQPAPEPADDRERTRLLRRADLIALARLAADAFASGKAAPGEVADAVGRRFELVLPFGCDGPADAGSSAPLRWRYDDKDAALRVHVVPTEWRAADWNVAESADTETIEGFWIARPWVSAESCPTGGDHAAARGMGALTLPGQTLAVAQFLPKDAPRDIARAGKPFEAVKRMEASAIDPAAGMRLRLSGRVDRVPGGGGVRCIQPGGAEQHPICLVAVALDEVRIENPRDDAIVASWPISRSDRAPD